MTNAEGNVKVAEKKPLNKKSVKGQLGSVRKLSNCVYMT